MAGKHEGVPIYLKESLFSISSNITCGPMIELAHSDGVLVKDHKICRIVWSFTGMPIYLLGSLHNEQQYMFL